MKKDTLVSITPSDIGPASRLARMINQTAALKTSKDLTKMSATMEALNAKRIASLRAEKLIK